MSNTKSRRAGHASSARGAPRNCASHRHCSHASLKRSRACKGVGMADARGFPATEVGAAAAVELVLPPGAMVRCVARSARVPPQLSLPRACDRLVTHTPWLCAPARVCLATWWLGHSTRHGTSHVSSPAACLRGRRQRQPKLGCRRALPPCCVTAAHSSSRCTAGFQTLMARQRRWRLAAPMGAALAATSTLSATQSLSLPLPPPPLARPGVQTPCWHAATHAPQARRSRWPARRR